jgi:hypothetical protein
LDLKETNFREGMAKLERGRPKINKGSIGLYRDVFTGKYETAVQPTSI